MVILMHGDNHISCGVFRDFSLADDWPHKHFLSAAVRPLHDSEVLCWLLYDLQLPSPKS